MNDPKQTVRDIREAPKDPALVKMSIDEKANSITLKNLSGATLLVDLEGHPTFTVLPGNTMTLRFEGASGRAG